MQGITDLISKTAAELTSNRSAANGRSCERFPSAKAVIDIVRKLRAVVLWEHHGDIGCDSLTGALRDIYEGLRIQLEIAFTAEGDDTRTDAYSRAADVSAAFISELGNIRGLLLKDAEAGYDGDPAARSADEVILSYPGMLAVFVYRMAHVLYEMDVPFIPRIMSEYAHGRTGIDIHPGARIGEYFFIDHGTSVVIGETAVIGRHVKLYQGVTLGALSTRGGQKLAGRKRHPTIEDNVTIYSGASILGGDTVIGENAVIGGNVFITQSVPRDTKVKTSGPA